MERRADLLTPKERVGAFLSGEAVDRIITMPIVTANTVHLIGKTVKEFQLDGEVMAKAHMAAFEKFGYDLVYLFTNCSYVAEAMGQKLVYSIDEPANCDDPIIKSRADLDKVKVATKDDGQLPVYYDALEILNQELADQVFLSVCFSGPLTTAATLRGTERFVRDTYKDPDLCHKLLRLATDSCKNFIKEIVSYEAMPIILEPIASGSLFSPKMFKEFAFPYNKELVDLAHELGALIPFHICGKTHKIVDLMADTGADVISIDQCDLEIAREKVGGRAVVLGNINPADELLFGPVERIYKVCKEAIDKMEGYTPGFFLSTGCETSNEVPMEHIEAFMDAARSYGTYDY
ncbi:uroporphyrinogen decarboxylase [Halanaerobium saccharolyticum]|uniref:Uroporphyrinogen decarboxylase n=1 Tax=Halanaerobium saccharolyticum TaxID=43595 RepID=A0A4R6LRL5_9FIRM|nr:uroporphyrinogen decarboxylase family protein [Halanaerobium saccharolyticum]TDO90116.1 uroporphyrinogen decarboxylase [Halanaerobium saccharolyticum]